MIGFCHCVTGILGYHSWVYDSIERCWVSIHLFKDVFLGYHRRLSGLAASHKYKLSTTESA